MAPGLHAWVAVGAVGRGREHEGQVRRRRDVPGKVGQCLPSLTLGTFQQNG